MVNIKITGKDVKATEAIQEYLDKKMDRIEKYFEGDIDVVVTIRTEKTEQIAEMSVKVKQDTYRAVTAHKDMYASIDRDIDILEGQIRKIKTRKDKANKDDSIKSMNADIKEENVIENEIIKTIYYDIKPMTPEDAKLKLQEKPQDRFITFINQETNKVNVLFKMKDNKNFGLVEPEA
jgi:putative sigma-54 modulation protein